MHDDEYDIYKNYGAYVLDDFKNMKSGDIHIMHYNCYNVGSFIWMHDRLDGDRAIGKCINIGENINDALEIEIYEFDGFMCVGSGAEPVCRNMPLETCFEYRL